MDASKRMYDIHCHIFQYLEFEDLIKVQQVCKMWKVFSDNSSLWQTIRLKKNVKNWDSFVDFMCKHKTRHLDLKNLVLSIETWKKFLENIPRAASLVELHLCKCPVFVIDDVIGKCPNLQFFKLSQCDLSIFKGASNIYPNTLNSEVTINLKLNTIQITEYSSQN